jgi:hypothetical protein
MMKMTMKTLCASLVSATALMGFGGQALAQKVTLTVTAPTGTAGNPFKTTTRFTPCRTGETNNFLTFTISATGLATGHDIYLLFRQPTGTPSARNYLSLQKTGLASGGLSIVAHNAQADGDALDGLRAGTLLPYLVKANHLGATFSETIFGTAVGLNTLATGTWQATAVVAGTGTGADLFDLGNPRTWAASDTVTFMLGAPWAITDAANTALTCPNIPAT